MMFDMTQRLLVFLFTISCSLGASAEEIYTGSGFFITSNGYFVTNYHVIKDADKIGLRDVQGKTYEAIVVKLDTNNDLALLKVKGTFRALPVINSQTVKMGTHVITVGFPNIDIQGKEPKLSEGIVSALSGIQDEPTVFQISVPIQPGNSGGPMVNMDGNVVGIIASKLSALYMMKNKGSVPENVNYAIKSNYLNELIQTDNVVSKLLLPPTKQPAKSLVELSERVEKSIALVFAVGKIVDIKVIAAQCSQAAKEGKFADALNLCKQAAAQGNDAAQHHLGLLYFNGDGVAQDYQEAVRLNRLSAAQGNSSAQGFLGMVYFNGKGISQDYYEAKKWFELAAAQGNATAQGFLGVMHGQGLGVAQDYQEAAKWFRLAAEQGDSSAQVMLSTYYIFGDGLAKDYIHAYMWASLAVDKDHGGYAQQNRNIAASNMTPSQIAEAQEMVVKCLQGNYKNCD
jgi:TPR repeat protein